LTGNNRPLLCNFIVFFTWYRVIIMEEKAKAEAKKRTKRAIQEKKS
jgi:hypothetical protein